MNRREEDEDELLAALATLPEIDVDAGGARDTLQRATAAFTRSGRHTTAAAPLVAFYTRFLEPLTACSLSLALLAATVAQCVFVLQHGIGLWR